MVINGDSFLSNEIAFVKSAESGIWATNERFIEFGNCLHAASIVASVLSGSKPNRDKNSFAFSVICDWIETNSDIPVILGLAIFLVESCLVSIVHLVGNHWWEQWSSCPGPGGSTSLAMMTQSDKFGVFQRSFQNYSQIIIVEMLNKALVQREFAKMKTKNLFWQMVFVYFNLDIIVFLVVLT